MKGATLTIPDVFNIQALPAGAPVRFIGGYLLPEGAGTAEFSGMRDYRAAITLAIFTGQRLHGFDS